MAMILEDRLKLCGEFGPFLLDPDKKDKNQIQLRPCINPIKVCSKFCYTQVSRTLCFYAETILKTAFESWGKGISGDIFNKTNPITTAL